MATVTNGEVFLDNLGEFTKIREQFLNYYPEPIRQNKIATRLMNISQHGQYNYVRCLRRNDLVSANQCLYLFVDEVIHLGLLLERALAVHFSEYVSMHWEKLCRDAVTGNQVNGVVYGKAKR